MLQAAIVGIHFPCDTEGVIMGCLDAEAQVDWLITAIAIVEIGGIAVEFAVRIAYPAIEGAIMTGEAYAVVHIFTHIAAVVAIEVLRKAGLPGEIHELAQLPRVAGNIGIKALM